MLARAVADAIRSTTSVLGVTALLRAAGGSDASTVTTVPLGHAQAANPSPHVDEACVVDLWVVFNTHLFYHTTGDFVRAVQTWSVLAFISTCVERIVTHTLRRKSGVKVTVVLGGDFNSDPTSGAFQLLNGSPAPLSNPDMQRTPLRAGIGSPTDAAAAAAGGELLAKFHSLFPDRDFLAAEASIPDALSSADLFGCELRPPSTSPALLLVTV